MPRRRKPGAWRTLYRWDLNTLLVLSGSTFTEVWIETDSSDRPYMPRSYSEKVCESRLSATGPARIRLDAKRPPRQRLRSCRQGLNQPPGSTPRREHVGSSSAAERPLRVNGQNLRSRARRHSRRPCPVMVITRFHSQAVAPIEHDFEALKRHCQVNNAKAVLPRRSSEVSPFQQAQVAVFQSVKARSLSMR